MMQSFVAAMLLCAAVSILLLPPTEPVPLTVIAWWLVAFAVSLMAVSAIMCFLPLQQSASRRIGSASKATETLHPRSEGSA